MKDIKLFLTDVDGTLTDGGMYYTSTGDTMKKFNTRDGMGLQLLQRAGVKVGIITSETTDIVTAAPRNSGSTFWYRANATEENSPPPPRYATRLGSPSIRRLISAMM